MAARAVCEGVGGGDLFEGQKFFLTQRVPMRNHYVDLIKANGGEVVPLEKQADMIVADHARKDQPVGSISYTWIESCIKSGTLVDIENHRAGPANQTARPVGSSQPARRGRVLFTAEDDRFLTRWCTRAERQGVSMKGNILYQQLEAVNNRHTSQSWRDRWLKYLSHLARPQDAEEEDGADQDGGGDFEEADIQPTPSSRTSVRPPQSSASRVSAPRSAQKPAQPSVQRKPAATLVRTNSEGSKSNASRPLTQRSRSISPAPLPQARRKIVARPTQSNIDRISPETSPQSVRPLIQKSAGGLRFSAEETQELVESYDEIKNIRPDSIIDAWLAWSFERPNHTAQEWSNYFVEYVAPKVERDRGKIDSRLNKDHKNASEFAPGPSTSRLAKRQSLEVKDSQGSLGQAIETLPNDEEEIDQSTSDEVVFRTESSLFAESFDLPIDFEPVICQRKISLFRLWQIVQSRELGGYDEVEGRGLWTWVARRLEFDDHEHPTAAGELRACFKDGILADFADAKQHARDNESLTDSQLQVMADEQLFGTAAPGLQDLEEMDEEEGLEESDDDLDLPQSTPKQVLNSTSSKHSLGNLHSGSPGHKRQRVDRGKGKEREIPSTPEAIINGNHLPRPQLQSSPLKYSSNQPPYSDDDDGGAEDDLILRSSIVRRNLTSAAELRASAKIQEPETQNFTFSAGKQDEPMVIDDLTPSPERTTARLPDNGGPSDIATPGTIPSSSRNDSSTQSQTSSQVAMEVRDQIDHFVSLGWAEDTIVDALIATSGQETNATHVMDSLVEGQGVPEHTPGIWFFLDDEDIAQGKGTVGWDRVVRKHGILGLGKRKQFLKSDKYKALLQRRKELDLLTEERLKQSRQQV